MVISSFLIRADLSVSQKGQPAFPSAALVNTPAKPTSDSIGEKMRQPLKALSLQRTTKRLAPACAAADEIAPVHSCRHESRITRTLSFKSRIGQKLTLLMGDATARDATAAAPADLEIRGRRPRDGSVLPSE
jgi:hypothetical protein